MCHFLRPLLKRLARRLRRQKKSHQDPSTSRLVPSTPGSESEGESDRQSQSSRTLSTTFDERLRRDLPERIPILLSLLDIQGEDVEYIGTGGSNIVFGFTDITHPEHLRCILRVQIWEPGPGTVDEMLDSAAILDFVSTRIKTVRPISRMDTSSDNPLLRPYTIQPRIMGVTFADAWDDMSLDQHTYVSKMVVDEMVQIEKIEFPRPGRLAASQTTDEEISLQNIKIYTQRVPLPPDHAQCSVEGWLMFLLDWRIELHGEDYYAIHEYRTLKKMLEAMISRGYFEGLEPIGRCVLSHGDVHGDNVIVARDPKETDRQDDHEEWKLAGFIDWDSARAIPRILARQPPEWLWADHLYEGKTDILFRWTGDLDFVPEEEWELMSEHMKELKRRVDEYASTVIEGYMEDAYGRGRWIRRVAKFAMERITDNREDTMLRWMIEEWEDAEGTDSSESGSSGSPGSSDS